MGYKKPITLQEDKETNKLYRPNNTEGVANKQSLKDDYGLRKKKDLQPSLIMGFNRNEYKVITEDGLVDSDINSLLAFTRGSVGTRVDHRGLVSEMAIDIPRITYDPITGECLGLLAERPGNNNFFYSEDLTNSFWNKTNVTVNANAITAPDGTLTADKIIEDSSTDTHVISTNLGFNFVAGTEYTQQYFVKAAGRTKVRVSWRSDWFPPDNDVLFDLSEGTATSGGAGGTGSIKAYPNGWFLIEAKSVADATGTSPNDTFVNIMDDAGDFVYTGDGVSGVYLWGFKLGGGSYISTTTTSETRDVDKVLRNLGAEYNPNGSTVFLEFEVLELPQANYNYLSGLTQTDTTNTYIGARITQDGTTIELRASDSNFVTISTNVLSGKNRLAYSFDGANKYACLNGGAVITTTNNVDTSLISQLWTSGLNNATFFQMSSIISEQRIYSKTISGTDLQELTAL